MKTKVCTKCNVEKSVTEYTKDRANKNGIRSECTICSRKMKRKDYAKHIARELIKNARNRAAEKNILFTITKEDIVIPNICPVFGIPIFISKGRASDNSPSIDRIVPEKGYTKENIWIISQRANRIKNDSSLSELKMLVGALERIENER